MDTLNDIFEEVLAENPALRQLFKDKITAHLHEMNITGMVEATAERVVAEMVEEEITSKYSINVEIFEDSEDEEFSDEYPVQEEGDEDEEAEEENEE